MNRPNRLSRRLPTRGRPIFDKSGPVYGSQARAARLATGPRRLSLRAAAKPLSDVLEPLELDAPTVADDATFFERVAAERNLPPGFAAELAALY